ncbi:HpcH/HpaI aldolase [Caballeronia hypogeia]|uniref:HpcH/HpaI aldolase n=1 Tax=Caballeronia hypogeia TaxID=1777140 RepID=A0A158DNP9_9BURK|nr:CoA ester lyase [Caballeronia hypogeia]SAK96040.1 HpcH/HpaI aldolase [Caballeronia hypogeia]
MRPMRSVLFVPGHKEGWPEKAVANGADGVILDLEDAVPLTMKEQAREIVAHSIRKLAAGDRKVGVYVRLNALETGITGDDLERIAIPGLDGVLLPKNYGPRDIVACDALITHFERKNGVAPGSIEIVVSLETAQAYAQCEEILAASPRVATLFAGTAKDADVSRSIGFQFTPGGRETLYLRSRALLAVRASGRQSSWVGLWQDLKDPDGARVFALQNRELGFTTMVMIHPSHIAVANEVFSPSEQDVVFYQGMIGAFEKAEAEGNAAVLYEGQHIDYAHIKTARQVLELHRTLTRVAS